MLDPLSDCSPLISAASSGRLRLVRLLVEGGAQVNGCNPRGETALLAVIKALGGEPAGPDTVKLLTYLLRNKADPNAHDQSGRTPLMYACMQRAGAAVASTLLSAGADPSMEDHSGASALVYAVNAQDQPTLKVLMDACRARGRDIIIIATETDVNGGPVTRRYLNVPPTPDTSPVSCMSPSDIVLKTDAPNSPEGENIFNFRGTSKQRSTTTTTTITTTSSSSSTSRHPTCEPSPSSQRGTPPPRQRVSSEPWLAVHNLARLNRAYKEATRERSLLEAGSREDLERGGEEDGEGEDEDEQPRTYKEGRYGSVQRRDNVCAGENYNGCREDCSLRASQSVLSLNEIHSSHAKWSGSALMRFLTPGRSTSDRRLPARPSPRSHIPSVPVVPPRLHLPPLANQADSHIQVPSLSKSRSMVFLPRPPDPSPSPSSSTCRASPRPALLPSPPLTSSLTSLLAPPASSYNERSRRSVRRHSVQLETRGDVNHRGRMRN